MRGKEKTSLASLYDKLETHMRALETLGVTTDKCAAMLFPLVESSLPEEILRVWQRSASASGNKDLKERLTKLMEFLCSEVEAEERISMAVAGFSLNKNDKGKYTKNKNETPRDVPTAMGLLTKPEKTVECIFCSNKHESQDCFKAKKLNLKERRDIVKNNNCCFNCLKSGHSYKKCNSKVRCAWCSKKHYLIMCPENFKSESGNVKGDLNSEKSPEQTLANFTEEPEVYLQTLRVKLTNASKECVVRVLIDTGSHRSYIKHDVASKMGYIPIETRLLTHSLFGGVKSQLQNHNVYLVHLKNLSSDYACNFQAMDQKVICDGISCVKSADWLNELKTNNICLSDIGNKNQSIDLLIGADVAGELFTGNKYEMKNGLTAIETLLGWTIMGKNVNKNPKSDTVLLTNTAIIEEAPISDLWHLDIIGIEDPVQKESKQSKEILIKQRFKDTAIFNNECRYEVCLPWINDHAPLNDNKNLALKSLENLMKNLKKKNITSDYDGIFLEWEKDGIIENVPEEELNNFCHYLPHRPVIKLSSCSTKIRPVFDASAREKNFPSLNQCLETGPNLIELIPSILLRFRKKAIGITADIKSAFLQINVNSEDRDYLRFIWQREDKIIIFRHKRVVFGVTCSPFLLGATIELHLERILKGDISTIARKDTVKKLSESFYSDNCVTSIDSRKELKSFINEATDALKTAGFELRRWE